jgi:general stress protein 26
MTREQSLSLIDEKIKGMRSCLFVTHGPENDFRARPMATQDITFDGSVWFMTDQRSDKYAELQQDNRVGLEYAHSNGVRFVSLYGHAEFVTDHSKIKEFWNPFYKAWFTDENDPNIGLLKVVIDRAEYWDNKGGKLGALADMAIGAITDHTNTLDEHEVIDLKK